MNEMKPRFGSTLPRKWAYGGMLTTTVILSVIIELLGRMPVVSPTPWWVWLMVTANFILIPTALAFVWLAAKTAIQQLMFSMVMIGTLVSLLFLYSLVP